MNKMVCLDEKYSTTRMLYKIVDDECLDEDGKIKEECKWNINNPEFNIKDSKLIGNPEDKFETTLFLPEGEGRKGEGGLRTKGYFKKSFEDKPLISIITVVFNGEKYLEETIQSVINQTYDNVEYIIIDGGSTDGTLDIIKKYEDQIDYWVSEKDKGIYDAMNKGIDLATGEWINFMNAGDGFYKDNTLSEIFVNNKYQNMKILYGDVETNYGNFKVIHKAGSLSNLYKSMQFSHQSIFFNSKYHKENKYNLSYKLSADYLNIISIYSEEKDSFLYLNTPISIVNTDGVSEINIFHSVLEHWKAVKQIKKNNLKLDFYYIISLGKQYLKNRFISDCLLTKFRNIKYSKKS